MRYQPFLDRPGHGRSMGSVSWLKRPMPWPVESPKFWLRHGGGVPSYDLPAKVGSPKGLRLKGPVPTGEAYNELRDRGFLKGPRLLELGKSFYAVKSRHGASLHGVVLDEGKASESTALHSVVALESLPRCRALLHRVLDLLGAMPILLSFSSGHPRKIHQNRLALDFRMRKCWKQQSNGSFQPILFCCDSYIPG